LEEDQDVKQSGKKGSRNHSFDLLNDDWRRAEKKMALNSQKHPSIEI
jgi:hypothetical protein